MTTVINARDLRQRLGEVVRGVRRGTRYTVLYRSRPAFDILPPGEPIRHEEPVERDSLYRAGAVGRSGDGRAADEHDRTLYR